MKGVCGTIWAKPDLAQEFVGVIRETSRAVCSEPGALYVDFYRTKHPDKFVILEMYAGDEAIGAHRDAAHTWEFAKIKDRYQARDPEFVLIEPVYSDPPERARPIASPFRLADYAYLHEEPPADELMGVLVNADIKLEQQDAFIEAIDGMGAIAAAGEPGFRYADLYRTPTPGHFIMVEFYQDKETLWGHQDYQHTKDWAARKGVYEVSKPRAFTLRPVFSEGRLRRSLIGG